VSITPDLLVDSYLAWIKRTVRAELLEDNITELTTPFLDRHNDYLQVYAEQQSPDRYLLTDDGYIIAELKSSGVEKRGPRREELLAELVSGYGVKIHGSELQTEATSKNLGQRVHNLIQAMLSVDDMFVLSQPNVSSIFLEDVAKFFDERDIRYTPRAKFAGKSGFDHLVDFVIPRSRQAPERIVQVVNSPRRNRIVPLLFAVDDTRAARGRSSEYYAVINDTKESLSSEVVHALEEYSVKAQPWSRRDELVEALVT
jgi:hypothetical protein